MPNPYAAIDARFGLEPLPAAGSPVFLLSAGWRSGSTLLQRIVVSSGEVLIWGEPYGRAGIVPTLSRAMLAFQPDWPAAAAIAVDEDLTSAGLHDQWIANLYPEPRAVRDSLRAMLDSLFAAPARRRGFGRFGLKEVRFSATDAFLLQWLYPDARFVFLVRNPWDAWSSMKGGTWYLRWPDYAVNTATTFAKVWQGLLASFVQWEGDSGMLLRYEDLKRPDWSLDPLRTHLALDRIDESVRATNLRGPVKPPTVLDPSEIEQITATVGALAKSFGYTAP
jgi:hypothetical protein